MFILVLILLAMGAFFYLGFWIGCGFETKLIKRQIKRKGDFLLDGKVYRAAIKYDLKDIGDIPDVLNDVPKSTNAVNKAD